MITKDAAFKIETTMQIEKDARNQAIGIHGYTRLDKKGFSRIGKGDEHLRHEAIGGHDMKGCKAMQPLHHFARDLVAGSIMWNKWLAF